MSRRALSYKLKENSFKEGPSREPACPEIHSHRRTVKLQSIVLIPGSVTQMVLKVISSNVEMVTINLYITLTCRDSDVTSSGR